MTVYDQKRKAFSIIKILSESIMYSWAEEERLKTLTTFLVLTTPAFIVFKDHMTGETIYQYSTRDSISKWYLTKERKKKQFFMWFSKAFVLPENYFIYFFYSGKSEYPIFLCTVKVKHRDVDDIVNIYVQFICILFLWNNDYVVISS